MDLAKLVEMAWRRVVGRASGSDVAASADPSAGDGDDERALRLVGQVAAQLAVCLDPEDTLSRVLDLVAEAFGAPKGSILLLDSQSGRLSVNADGRRGRRSGSAHSIGHLGLGQGLGGWVAEQRRGVVVADVERDGRWIWPPGRPHDVRSAVCVPAIYQNEVQGVITLAHPKVDHFRDRDLPLLASIAAPVAVVVHDARLDRALQSAGQRSSQERQRLIAAFELLPDGLAILDRQFRPVLVNRAATSLLGLQGSSKTSLPALLATGRLSLHGGNQERALDLLAASEANPDEPAAADVVGENGRTLRLTLAPVVGRKRQVLALALHVRDNTREHELERLRRDVVSSVSHELQTPLASIRACAEMLLDEADESDPGIRRRLLGIVAGEAEHLSAFVGSILDLSRLEGGQLRPEKSLVDARWVAAEVVAALASQARAAQVTVAVEDEGQPCFTLADEQMLGMILNNLVGNSIKYNRPRGHVWLQLRQGPEQATLTVVDDGPGIPVEALPHVFERFYRARPARDSGARGTGLGLALVKDLVEAHGGTIEIESELGRGTSFRVCLPAPERVANDGAASFDPDDQSGDGLARS